MAKKTRRRDKKPAESRGLQFDIDRLRLAAGETVFARGVAYHQHGQVEILGIEGGTVRARVQGSQIYRTELTSDRALAGTCTCPAFDDRGICKHLVATALAANELEPAEVERMSGQRDRVREHLRAKGVDTLVEMVMEMAALDPGLFQSRDLAAAADEPDEKALVARFRTAIDSATRTNGFLPYQEARGWAQGVEDVLDRIAHLVERGHAGIVLQLLDRFMERIEASIEEVDDSDGHFTDLVDRAREIHLAACREAKPDVLQLARALFARERESDWGFFDAAKDAYADVLGGTGLAELHRLAEAAWQKIKPLARGDDRVHDEQFSDRHRLGGVLEWFAERNGDVEARIAIRAKDLSSLHAYLGLAELCLQHRRKPEALKWLEDGLRLFDKDIVERHTVEAARLYRRLDRHSEADRLLWQAFERSPSLSLYNELKQAAKADRAGVGAIADRAVGMLKARIASADRRPSAQWPWSSPADLLCQVLIAEGRLSEAWAAARSHGCRDDTLKSLARTSEGRHPAEALDAYVRLVEQEVSKTAQLAYEAACRIIGRVRTIRERLGQSAEHAAWVEDLAARHKAKRNFIKLLRAPSRKGPRPR